VAGFEKRPGAFVRPGAVIIEPAGKAHKAKAQPLLLKVSGVFGRGSRPNAASKPKAMHSQGKK